MIDKLRPLSQQYQKVRSWQVIDLGNDMGVPQGVPRLTHTHTWLKPTPVQVGAGMTPTVGTPPHPIKKKM